MTMRLANLFLGLPMALFVPVLLVGSDIVERGLVVCQQQHAAPPVVALASVQSSEILVPVATASLPPEGLPPQEGRPCAEVLSDLTREGYSLVASTPLLKRSPDAAQNFLLRQPAVTERLEWTIQLPGSVAFLLCDPLADTVEMFSDGASPSDYFVPTGANCTVHLAALLVQGGEILGRTASLAPGTVAPVGPIDVYTAHELMRTFPEEDLPRLSRANNGRNRLP